MAKVGIPIYALNEPSCPCCDGQGYLCLLACTQCGAILGGCAEVGTEFQFTVVPDVSPRVRLGEQVADSKCPTCRMVNTTAFIPATLEQIERLGLRWKEDVSFVGGWKGE